MVVVEFAVNIEAIALIAVDSDELMGMLLFNLLITLSIFYSCLL